MGPRVQISERGSVSSRWPRTPRNRCPAYEASKKSANIECYFSLCQHAHFTEERLTQC
ncbi:hypothetical protein B0H17DRAFT_255822 [Mycena rosella]|uniref:Uncharacterized protein n=1 Tax=Mycena rosella TaxID=1033263 RepID=A0AAD7G583_MYCRO|nr:hypothetical protein B0H17DRAFT_255822 [Mycena rosella]